MRRKEYYLLTIVPTNEELARLMVKAKKEKLIRKEKGYAIYTKLDKEKKERITVLLPIQGKSAFILFSNSTYIAEVRKLSYQLRLFDKHKAKIGQILNGNRNGWKTAYVRMLFGDEELSMAKLNYQVELNLTTDEIKRLLELYLEGELDGIEMLKTPPENPGGHDLYILDSFTEKSPGGLTETLTAVILAL